MDILNFISWIKGKRIVTTVPPTQTLIPVGLKDGRRDDEYLAGAITYQDLAAQLALTQSCKIIINGTGGLSNTQNGVDFLVLYNTIAWNESLNDFTPTGSKIRINTPGKYLVLARYSSYDMTAPLTDFMRIGVTKSNFSTNIGNKIEYLDQGVIQTGINGEATKAGSGVFEFIPGDFVGIVAFHTGATGGPFGNDGYPVFDNTFYNQPHLEIVKLS
jgi:hypothetical protein